MNITTVVEAIKHGLDSSFDSDACRFFHGRGKTYEGLSYINVDWFKPVLLITLYRQMDDEEYHYMTSELSKLDSAQQCILVQHRYKRGAPTDVLWGELPEQTFAAEDGLKFSLSFGEKQNIGFFMDMEPGRRWLKQRAKGLRVLNLFSYTCTFSVAAIHGGAKTVMNVDMSSGALTVGRENHRINQQSESLQRDVQFLSYNIFRSWKRITKGGPFDIVIVDPPSRQKGSFVAENDYAKVLRRLPALLSAGGDVLLCLNAPELGENFLVDQLSSELPSAVFIGRLENRADFPEVDRQRNLKMLHYRL